jgi:membrane associated rhomboid family serine protease/Tfp pilus assembly protein PilF
VTLATQADERASTDAPELPEPSVRRRRFGVARILILANIAVFAVMCLRGASPLSPTSKDGLDMGANYGPLVAAGEWWRLITAAFVHFGVLHLALNMYALNPLSILERPFGTRGFLYVYIASALGASVSSVLFHPGNVSAGASGAIFGLDGGLLAFALTHRQLMAPQVFRPVIRSILITITINVGLGFTVGFVDNAGHIGGLVTKFVAGLCVSRDRVAASDAASQAIAWAPLPRKRVLSAVVLALAILGAAAYVPVRVSSDPAIAAKGYLWQAQFALDRGELARTHALLDRAEEASPDDAWVHQLRASLAAREDDHGVALAELDRALALDDSLSWAHRTRAIERFDIGKIDEGLRDLDRTIELDKNDIDAYERRAHVLFGKGVWDKALQDFHSALAHDTTGEMQVYVWLARAHLRTREGGTMNLAGFLESDGASKMDDAWRRIALVFVGKSTEAALLEWAEAAASDGSAAARTNACRAYFAAASLRELGGDKAEARKLLERSLALSHEDYFRWWDAQWALQRLSW